MSYAARAERYARAVVAGDVLACRLVRLACARHLDDLKRSRKKDYPFRFDAAKTDRVCQYLELLPHVKGAWARRSERLKLEDWQCFAFGVPFGWVKKSNGLRRYRRAYTEIPRKNAKSTATAGLGLYMATADGEHGAEVYSGAGSEKQAWEVFGPARLMAKNTPDLLDAYGLEVNAKSLSVPANGSKFEPIIGKPGDGASPSFSITDEYHEHPTDEQLDTMVTGMGSREQPMAWVITTAGFDIASPCYALREEVVKALEGTVPNDELWGLVYTIDEGDDWTSEEALRKANPNLGVSVYEEYLKSQQKDAINNPRKAATFKTKHLNVWVQARDPWMNMEAWKAQGDDALTEDLFRGQRCFVGLDLSSKLDLSGVVRVFRYDREDTCSRCKGAGEIDGAEGREECPRCEGSGRASEPEFYVFPRAYLPEERAEAPECQHYQGWVRTGHLIATDGNAIDYARIEEDLRADAATFEVAELAFDPWGATQLAQNLAADGMTTVEVPQTTKYLSDPMKEIEALVLAGRLHHPAHPVMDWCMSNVKAREDANENVFPRKESREAKIDLAVALINAMARALADPAPEPVPYESDGITFL